LRLRRYLDHRAAYRELARTSRNPVTFDEKIRWRMAFDRRPHLTLFADKVAVRDFVAQRAGPQYLKESYGVYERGSDIDWSCLPRRFAVKASHGCKGNVLVWEGAPRGRFPAAGWEARWDMSSAHPDDLDHSAMSRLSDGWLRLSYEYGPSWRFPEWAYRNVPPRIIIEELLTTEEGPAPTDFCFFMFDGKCGWIQHNYERLVADRRRDILDADWNLLPATRMFGPPDVREPRPDTLEEMLAVSEALSRGSDFVRVDLYSIDGRVVFGELTNYPDSGGSGFEPREMDKTFGDLWTLPVLGA
jgi:hypothetical protein